MTIEIVKTALVRGCFNRKAIINVRGDDDKDYYYGRDFYMYSPAPQTLEQAGHINQQLVLLMLKVNGPTRKQQLERATSLGLTEDEAIDFGILSDEV